MKQKIRSQRGATGADVLVALGVILIAITVVSVFYVNTVIVSRAVVRASGATRIATNIVENINSMLYKNVINEFENKTENSTNGPANQYELKQSTDNPEKKIFNTKIPEGFKVKFIIDDVYSEPGRHFDIAKKIKIIVTYKVSGNEKDVSLSLTKKIEMCEPANEPDFSTIPLEDMQSYLPISKINNQVKIVDNTTSDSGWYDYTDKLWAIVFVDKTVDINILRSQYQDNIIPNNITLSSEKIYCWIPRFAGNDALYGITNYPIKKAVSGDGYDTITFFTPSAESGGTVEPDPAFDYQKGIWVKKSELYTNSVSKAFLLTDLGRNGAQNLP